MTQYIYEPSRAPLALQVQAKCIIGQDYPFPMLDEKEEKRRCLAKMKQASIVGLTGTSPSVLTGSVTQRFSSADFDEANTSAPPAAPTVAPVKKSRHPKETQTTLDQHFKKQRT